MIILGGGVVKHHVCNANLMRNGADYSVFINTGMPSFFFDFFFFSFFLSQCGPRAQAVMVSAFFVDFTPCFFVAPGAASMKKNAPFCSFFVPASSAAAPSTN
jgi:hypothetical protein